MQNKAKFSLVQEETVSTHEIIRETLVGRVKASVLKTVYDMFEQEIDALCGRVIKEETILNSSELDQRLAEFT